MRGRLAITEQDLAWLDAIYDDFVERAGETVKQFVLPQGSLGATALHTCRSEQRNRTVHYIK